MGSTFKLKLLTLVLYTSDNFLALNLEADWRKVRKFQNPAKFKVKLDIFLSCI